MYDDRVAALRPNSFIQKRFEERVSAKWITKERRWRALDMMVLDEKPLLPPDLDVDAKPFEPHLRWWSAEHKDLHARAKPA